MADLVSNASVVKSSGEEIDKNQEQSAPKRRRPPLSIDLMNWLSVNRLFVIFAVGLLLLYNVLVKFCTFKYENGKGNPFETRTVLVNTSVIAFCVAPTTLLLLLHQFLVASPTSGFYKIMKTVFFFSAVVANISLFVILISV